MRRAFTLLALSLVAACAGSPSADEEIATSSARIIKGIDSDASQDSVVLIMHYDTIQAGGGSEGCTGVMLTPRLVLTARHCVSTTDDVMNCGSDGNAITGGAVQADFRASTIYVFSGNKRPSESAGVDGAVRGVEVFVPPVKTLCNNDLALVLLDRAVPNAKISPVRLEATTKPKELVTVVGWGITETTTYPPIRQQRTGAKVIELGPGFQIGPAEFKVSEGACIGDSGGPAFSEASGAVLGVLSRGGNFTGAPGAESCVDSENVFSSLAHHEDLIRSAYEKAGQEPWLEGSPNPLLRPFGGICAGDDECQSSICNANACSQSCDDAECPAESTCSDFGGRSLCVGPSTKTTTTESGCALPTSLHTSRASLIAMLVAGTLVAVRRRRAR